MGRVKDYLHRISMYIGNLQKRADLAARNTRRNAETMDEVNNNRRLIRQSW
ncbi:MAG: hypothetical protein OJF51_001333 [Nitrospira sp.]|nr:MAG: hypothetical protein OJF51_001333 [Nitrospira sp.]